MDCWLQWTGSLTALGRGPVGVGEGPGRTFSLEKLRNAITLDQHPGHAVYLFLPALAL